MRFKIFSKNADQVASPSVDDLKYLEVRYSEWLISPERQEMLTAEAYYDGIQDIKDKQRTAIGSDGNPVVVSNLPNNIIVDNQYRKCVDQKANYALSKPLTIATEDDSYTENLQKIFCKKNNKQMKRLARSAINGGLAYLFPYIDGIGMLRFKVFPSYEVMPIWEDHEHDTLVSAVRGYIAQEWRNGSLHDVEHIEVYTDKGVDCFIRRGGKFTPEAIPHKDYLISKDGTPYNWGRLPIIPFKYNDKEIPLIRNVKCLQDAINRILSTFQDNLEEDPRNTILVLENYDGTNLGEFRHNLATYGAVKVHTVDGVKGGVNALSVEVNAENYKSILIQLKRALIENARGFDAKEERMDGDPNQMNIQSMYSDIDLDIDGMENEFQCGFEELIGFINQYLVSIGEKDYSEQNVEFIFDRNIMINEGEAIQNCMTSKGVISDETIMAHHPWVVDLAKEKRQVASEHQDELAEMTAFANETTDNTTSTDESDGDNE